MKISGGVKEDGVVVGNAYDKYGSNNPIVQLIMTSFNKSLYDLVSKAMPTTILEVGCGEGYWVVKWNRQGIIARGSDFSSHVIEIARDNAIENGLSPDIFEQRSIYDVDSTRDTADLIVCCEVLEHLTFPEEGLTALRKVVKKNLILSVPREPVWRALNIMRGKYLTKLGNTPGHLQHWSRSEFIKLVGNYFDIVDVKNPFPWTMILCRNKDNNV